MRSLIIAAFILSLGVLSSLPFRRDNASLVVQVPEDATLSAIGSPLTEIDESEFASLTDATDDVLPSQASPLGWSERRTVDAVLPDLPSSRSLDIDIAQPPTMLPSKVDAQDPPTLTGEMASQLDWKVELPMDYVAPSTSDADVLAEVSEPPLPHHVMSIPKDGMTMIQAGNQSDSKLKSSIGTQASSHAEPGPRKRFFIYEPVN